MRHGQATVKSIYHNSNPAILHLQRTIPSPVNSWIEIGNFRAISSAHSIRLSTSNSGGISGTRHYFFVSANSLFNSWTEHEPTFTTGPHGDTDYVIDVQNVTTQDGNGVFSLRLRRLSGVRLSVIDLRIEYLGNSGCTFIETNATGTNTLALPKVNILTQNLITRTVNVSENFSAGNYRINNLNVAPVSATATGTIGEIRYTSDYIYVCVGTNQWKRTPLVSW